MSPKVRATKAKKAASNKPQRPAKLSTAPRTRKSAPAKSPKATKTLKASKTTPVRKPGVSRPANKTASRKQSAAPKKGIATAKSSRRVQPKKAAPVPVKKTPAPGALAAVKAFEQGLRLFNRHDFGAAKELFDSVLEKFSEQHEVVARTRTYLSICEQRLSRTPTLPKNPDGLYNQGVFELNRNNVQAAIELFEKVIKVDGRADHAFYSLAAAYARINEQSKALDALRRAIALRPVHRPHARRDFDFANLRTNEGFQQLTGYGFDFIEE